MRNFLVHNKLPGKAQFEIGVFPQFYSWPDCFVPVPVTLNPQIGNENNWEKGKNRPQAAQLAALVAVRGIGKRDAMQRLELLAEEE